MDVVWVLDFKSSEGANAALVKLADWSKFLQGTQAGSSTHWAVAQRIEPFLDEVLDTRVTVLANHTAPSTEASQEWDTLWGTKSLLEAAGIDGDSLASEQRYQGNLVGAAPLSKAQPTQDAAAAAAAPGAYNLIVKLELKKKIVETEFWAKFEPLRVYCLESEPNTWSYEAFQVDETTLIIVERYDVKASLTEVHHKSTTFLTFAPWLGNSGLVADKVRLCGVVNQPASK